MYKDLENQVPKLQAEAIDQVVVQITSQPKRQYTQAEIFAVYLKPR